VSLYQRVIHQNEFALPFLLFLVVDATRLCLYWIRGLRYKDMWWDKHADDSTNQSSFFPSYKVRWSKLHLIAERMEEVQCLIYHPFIVPILMLLSRITYFNNLGFPLPIAIVICINLVIAGNYCHPITNGSRKGPQSNHY
jgi:hypothetical protein